MNNIYDLLAEPFPSEVERTLTKSGTRLTYIPVSEVIARLNRVLGVDGWSSETITVQRDHLDPDWVIARVRVTARVDGVTVVRDGVGGQQVKRNKKGEIVDLGDEFKGAESDAFKKAAQKFGIGLYLARTEEALYAEQEHYTEDKQSLAPSVVGCDPDTWKMFDDHMKSMDPGEIAALKEWWNITYPGLGRPNPETCTTDEIASAVTEIVRIRLGAEQVEG
jgi:hypothetical protein